MRKLKRFASVLLALVMCFGLTVTAFADSYTITITNSVEGYTYTAYQVFDGDVSGTDDDAKMANIVWGSNVDYTTTVDSKTIYQALAAIVDSTDNSNPFMKANPDYDDTDPSSPEYIALTSAAEVAAVLANYSDDDAVVQAFAEAIEPYLTTSNATSSYSSGAYTISVDDLGYYLVKTTGLPATGYNSTDDNDTAANGGYTRYILTLVDSTGAEANTKSDSPVVDKAIAAEDVDASIGDTINYTLTATLPDDYSSYDTYKLVFHDVMSTGLTFDGASSVTVYVGDASTGTEVDSSGYSVTTSPSDGCTFEVTIANTKALTSDGSTVIDTTKDSIITVTFTATLNANAVIGGAGNPNEVYLEYSNNPNSGYETSTGKTPKDKVVTWTYTLKVTKVDGSNTTTTLENAEFVLYRKGVTDVNGDGVTDDEDIEYVVVDSNNKVTGWTPYIDDQAATDAGVTSGYTVAATLTSGSDGVFYVIGLDDDVDTYYLKEVTAPTGYNLPSDSFEVKITATHTTTDGTDTSTSTINTVDLTQLDNLEVTVDGDNGTGDKDTGVVSVNVENNEGIAMPSTGGIGTTIFYVVGGVLVAGAVVLLITRKRMKDDQ